MHAPPAFSACFAPGPAQLAYLAVSLLLDPASELAIMVVATIQADLRSDNFLTGQCAFACIACLCCTYLWPAQWKLQYKEAAAARSH